MLISNRHKDTRAFWRRVARNDQGLAALEFALIAPLMILLFVGLAQLSSAIIASRHTSHAVSSLGDLVSQCSNVSDTDVANIFSAASDIMAPLPATTAAVPPATSPTQLLSQRVTSVEVTDAKGTTQAQWSQATSGQTAYATGAAVTLPANLVTNQGDSVIMAETKYTYTFGNTYLSKYLSNIFVFDNLSYFKPRKSALVSYTGSGPGGSGTQTSCYSS